MNIDIVAGNPPYQDGNKSIYNLFIDRAIEICKEQISMVVKNNWLNGETLSSTRNNIIRNGLRYLINFPIEEEIFKGINTPICIFSINKKHKQNRAEYIEIRENRATEHNIITVSENSNIITNKIMLSIINKVTKAENFRQYDLAKNARMFSISSNGRYMHADYTEDCIEYNEHKDLEKGFNTEVIFLDTSKNTYSKWIKEEQLPRGKEFVNKYKVICGCKALTTKNVITNIHILEPGQVITNSFGIIGITDSLEEARAIEKYVRTKFYRILVKFAISGDKVSYGVGCCTYVPLLKFKDNSEIDWKADSVDKQLYKKYNLTDEEINYIETEVKAYT